MYKKTFIALLDQAMLSAINMVIALVFIKFSSKLEYGEYSLAFAVIMFACGLHNTLIHLPLTVTGNKLDEEKRAVFSASLCLFLYAMLIPAIGIVALYLFVFRDSLMLQPRTCWALLFSIGGILSRELARSLFFADLKVAYVFVVDFFYAVLFVCSLGILYSSYQLTGSNVIACMGGCSLIAALSCMKPVLANIKLPERWRDFYENVLFSWKDSKWMVAGMILAWIINNGYLFLLAYLVSKEAVAELNGTRVLIAPLVIVVGAWGKIFIPKGSSMVFNKQHRRITGILVKSTVGLLVIASVYISGFYLASDFLASSLYNSKYDHIGRYILLWGGFVSITIICSNLQNLISIFSRFKELFFFGLINSSLFLIYSYFLISRFAAIGAVCSLIIAKIILSLQYGGYYYTKRHLTFAD